MIVTFTVNIIVTGMMMVPMVYTGGNYTKKHLDNHVLYSFSSIPGSEKPLPPDLHRAEGGRGDLL